MHSMGRAGERDRGAPPFVFAATDSNHNVRLMHRRHRAHLDEIVCAYRRYPWFAHAGEPRAGARVARDLSHAWDGYWNGWNTRSRERWLRASRALERAARRTLGDDGIEETFATVAASLGPPIWDALGAYLERASKKRPDRTGVHGAIAIDLLEEVKRDLAWAAIEASLEQSGFFSDLLPWYREGRRLCGWIGGSPKTGIPMIL